MIRMFQSQTSAQAKNYFRDALSKADYYIEDQENEWAISRKNCQTIRYRGANH